MHIISGGDDGVICSSILDISQTTPQLINQRKRLGHASSVKGMTCVLHLSPLADSSNNVGIVILQDGSFVSASTDQRIIRWKAKREKLHVMQTLLSDVADVACLAVSNTSDMYNSWVLAVSGIGLEFLTFADVE